MKYVTKLLVFLGIFHIESIISAQSSRANIFDLGESIQREYMTNDQIAATKLLLHHLGKDLKEEAFLQIAKALNDSKYIYPYSKDGSPLDFKVFIYTCSPQTDTSFFKTLRWSLVIENSEKRALVTVLSMPKRSSPHIQRRTGSYKEVFFACDVA